MADDKDKEKNEDSGLGNLPPLSDFDSQSSDFDSGGEFYSQGEISSDSGLPPLGQGEISSDSGLSPLSDFDSDKGDGGTDDPFADLGSPGASAKEEGKGGEEDPFSMSPEGGSAQTDDLIPSSDFDTPMFESDFGGDDEEDDDDDFGAEEASAAGAGAGAGIGGGGFGGSEDPFAGSFDQPVPPGPDSGIDTPLTDSAFGGDTPAFGTPAPTQAMQTPMFGEAQPTMPQGGAGDMGGGGQDMFGGMQAPGQQAGGGGMDFGDFGGGTPAGGMDMAGMGGGTPPPDFTPDTGVEGMTPMGMEPVAAVPVRRGGASPVLLLVAAVVALLIGLAVGGRIPVSTLNPAISEAQNLQNQITQLNMQLQQLQVAATPDQPFNPEEIEQLRQEWTQLRQNISNTEAELASLSGDIQDQQIALEEISQDVSAKNDEFIEVEKLYQARRNQLAIIEARQTGLVAEVDRLTSQVGQLEDANLRRVAVKDALAHNVNRLHIQVKEGNPLTPEKFSYNDRVRQVEELRAKVAEAQWVTPELQNAYSSIYLREMQIAATQEYFYARLPLTDRYGVRGNRWAECLMKGNWGVLYRTLDGQHIGVYTNVGTAEAPIWEFRDNLPSAQQKDIEQEIFANRADNWEEMVRVLAERQLATQESTPFQAAFSSL